MPPPRGMPPWAKPFGWGGQARGPPLHPIKEANFCLQNEKTTPIWAVGPPHGKGRPCANQAWVAHNTGQQERGGAAHLPFII